MLSVGSTAVTVWDIAKWPVLLIIIGLILAILFWASPNARHGFQWVSPGGITAVVLWLVASGLFAVYVANFSHYNKIYGSLGRHHHLPDLDVDLQCRHPARGRIQRRA